MSFGTHLNLSENTTDHSSQVIPEDIHVDARLFAVRSAKHVRIQIFISNESRLLLVGIRATLAIGGA